MRSVIETVRHVSLEVIIFYVLLSTMKKIEPFWGVFGFILGDFLQLVLKDNVSDVAVIFDDYTPLELLWILYLTTSDDLYCKHDMEEIIFCE